MATLLMAVHFIGFRGDEYGRASLVWGLPDFIHLINDTRIWREVTDEDIVIFGPAAHPSIVAERSGDDLVLEAKELQRISRED